jgi:hypothetical protein
LEPSQELLHALQALYIAMSSGNHHFVESFYSLQDGGVFLGTDESEYWTDASRHNADVRSFFDGSEGRSAWATGPEPVARCEGSVGWTVDRPTIRLPSGERIQARVTLIWHREGDAWRIVHSHASIGMT